MTAILRICCALALAAWFGAMLFFSSGVAPVAFATLPDRVLAGSVVNASIARLHGLGYGAGVVLVVAMVLRARTERSRLAWLKAGLAGVVLALTLASGLLVAPPMAEIRARVGAIDALPVGSPDHQRFDLLHQLSVTLMSINLLVTAVIIGLDQFGDRGATFATTDGGGRKRGL